MTAPFNEADLVITVDSAFQICRSCGRAAMPGERITHVRIIGEPWGYGCLGLLIKNGPRFPVSSMDAF